MVYFDINDESHDDETDEEYESHVDGKVSNPKDKKKLKIASSILKKSVVILLVSMIFLTIGYLTYLGMFIFLKNQTATVQNVTVSSEGPIRKVVKKIMFKSFNNFLFVKVKCILRSWVSIVSLTWNRMGGQFINIWRRTSSSWSAAVTK